MDECAPGGQADASQSRSGDSANGEAAWKAKLSSLDLRRQSHLARFRSAPRRDRPRSDQRHGLVCAAPVSGSPLPSIERGRHTTASDVTAGSSSRPPVRRYACDIASADRERIKKGKTPPTERYCSRKHANLANPRTGRPTGYVKPGLEATERPTALDIAWGAGIFEGEGNCSDRVLQITQADTWILERLRALFGGSIQERSASVDRRTGQRYKCYHWSITGSRKRGFMMTIYKFLSPRRQEQIRTAQRSFKF